jgi:hypothetical protein
MSFYIFNFKLMKQHKIFLKNTFFLVFGLYLAIGIFNLTVDPYGIYNLVKIKGVNHVKPPWDNQERMVKILQIKKIRPKGIILGSSRTDLGLDPEQVALKFGARPVYNLSLPYISTEEIHKLLKYANSFNELNIAIIGLDFFAFNIFHPETVSGDIHDLTKLAKDGDTKFSSLVKEFQNTLFSYTAIEKSLNTISYKGKQTRSPYGQKIFIDERSARVLSRIALTQYNKYIWFPDKNRMYCLYNKNNEGKKFKQLGEVINFSIRKNIELKLFINPVHADLLEMIRFLNLWPIYENWKRGLVDLIATINKLNPKEAPITLWDFGDYNSITTEKFPLPTDLVKTMKGYVDLAHYKKRVGDLMLDKFLAHPNNQKIPNQKFGQLINTQNIEEHLKNIKSNRLQYQNENREHLKEMRVLWKELQDRLKSYPCIY